MSTMSLLLARAEIDTSVFELRPDYRALLVAVEGLTPGPPDAVDDQLVREAEAAATAAMRECPAAELAHVAAWREAYRAFGAKPQRTATALRPCCDVWTPACRGSIG